MRYISAGISEKLDGGIQPQMGRKLLFASRKKRVIRGLNRGDGPWNIW
jgi:hypothetical protein